MTAQELAVECGVSRGTVDRALNGRPGISAGVKEKILEAASRHGYRPNFIGKALSSGQTMTIGIVIFDFRHGFFAELYSAFEQEADRFNYVTFPMLSYHDPAREVECVKRLADRNVDGIILLPVNRGEPFEATLKSLNIPVVCIANRLSRDFPFSGIDDQRAAHDAVAFLASQGHRRVYYYCPPMRNQNNVNLYAQEQRLRGYEAGLAASGVIGEAVTNRDALLPLLAQAEDGTAVLCSSDFYALELQIFLRDYHPHRLRSVTLMGFDGLDVVKFSHPQIATVAFSRQEWAFKAFGQIYGLLSKKEVGDEVIAHEILEKTRQELK